VCGHICTHARIEAVAAALPKYFADAVYNSQAWKWEREQDQLQQAHEGRTSCLSTFFPKDDTRDVTLTILCGHEDAVRINEIFEVRLEPPQSWKYTVPPLTYTE
jgi:hypothetical protein